VRGTEIVIVTRDGQRLDGSVQIIDSGPFRGTLLVRPPRGLVQVFDPAGLDHPALRAERWQNLADRGAVYFTDCPGRLDYRLAMARWWRQAARQVAPPSLPDPGLTPTHRVIE
jgi:hypothetical protein